MKESIGTNDGVNIIVTMRTGASQEVSADEVGIDDCCGRLHLKKNGKPVFVVNSGDWICYRVVAR